MGYLGGFLVSFKQQGPKQRVTRSYPEQKRPRPVRLHGRHVLNRYEDGTEKCIGCELCAGVCPAKCIYVRGRDNPADAPVSPGERWGYVYEINYLRCIHCDLCVEACPTEAITDSKLFEFSFTNRTDAIYTRQELLVDAETGKPQQLPWEDWRPGEDLYTSGWVRATAPSGNAAYENKVAWGGDRGFGVREPEKGQEFEGRGTGPTVMIHPPDDPDAGTRIMALAQREPRTEPSYDAEKAAELVEDIVAGRATPTKPSYGTSEES